MKIAVYPGSFDPITNGHLEVLKRALKVFDKVYMLVATNENKKSTFTPLEKEQLVKEAVKEFKNVEVASTSGLTIDFCKQVKATHLIRGLRAVTDFEYEFQLAAANEYIDETIDIVFFMSRKKEAFISSSTIISLYKNGVDITPLVPPCVLDLLKIKFSK